MQERIPAGGETPSRLPNPLLDVAIASLEAQLKAWQAYQVEGTLFVAKRMRANLEYMRKLGHCSDIESTGECRHAWLNDALKDYTEEWARISATTFALCFGELSGLGWLFGQRATKGSSDAQTPPRTGERPTSRPGYQAAA